MATVNVITTPQNSNSQAAAAARAVAADIAATNLSSLSGRQITISVVTGLVTESRPFSPSQPADGYTPDPGARNPTIEIDAQLSFPDAEGVIAHEIAHVAAPGLSGKVIHNLMSQNPDGSGIDFSKIPQKEISNELAFRNLEQQIAGKLGIPSEAGLADRINTLRRRPETPESGDIAIRLRKRSASA